VRREEKTAVMGTGIGNDEQSAPVKEKRREKSRRSKSGGQSGERKRERETGRVITAESFCRGIFQNDWAL